MRDRLREVLGIDLRTLAVIRVGLGLFILGDLYSRSFDLTAHYTDHGVLPRMVAMVMPDGVYHASLYLAHGGTWLAAALFLITAVFAVGLLFGYRSRLCALACFVLMLSLHHRNPVLLDGADELLLTLLFWTLFLPIGARWSVDAALIEGERPTHDRCLSVPTAALVIQIACVYLFAALLKTGDEWWPDGSAVYYALHIDQFATPLTPWLREAPAPLLRAASYFVLALEFAAPLLVLSPWRTVLLRTIVVPALAFMHLGFLLFLKLGMFPFVSLLSLSVFAPTAWWEACSRRMRTPSREAPAIFYDGDCSFCLKAVLILRELLGLPEAEVRRAQSDAEAHALLERHSSWVVRDAGGSHHVAYDALVVLVRHSPLFSWLARPMSLQAARRLGDRLHRRMAEKSRGHFGRAADRHLPYRPLYVKPSPRGSLIAGVCLIWIVGYNITTLEQVQTQYPAWLAAPGKVLRQAQTWSFFSPQPSPLDGWFVMPGRLEDGTPVEVMSGQLNVDPWLRPDSFYETFPSYRWRALLNNIRRPSLEMLRPFYARYLCWRWNRLAPQGRRLREFDILFMLEATKPGGGPFPVEKAQLSHHDCLEPEGSG